VKQQYWVMVNQQKAAEGHEFDEPITAACRASIFASQLLVQSQPTT
jgi:hypothetical protein